MSTAEKIKHKFLSCLHVRKIMFDFFHRAKPVNEENRRFSECAVRTDTVQINAVQIDTVSIDAVQINAVQTHFPRNMYIASKVRLLKSIVRLPSTDVLPYRKLRRQTRA